jgi:hypothetical protein
MPSSKDPRTAVAHLDDGHVPPWDCSRWHGVQANQETNCRATSHRRVGRPDLSTFLNLFVVPAGYALVFGCTIRATHPANELRYRRRRLFGPKVV